MIRSFFKELWDAIRDIRRAGAELTRLRNDIHRLEQRILDQHDMIVRVARGQNTLTDRIAPPLRKLGG